jgi:hypothetical protein
MDQLSDGIGFGRRCEGVFDPVAVEMGLHDDDPKDKTGFGGLWTWTEEEMKQLEEVHQKRSVHLGMTLFL